MWQQSSSSHPLNIKIPDLSLEKCGRSEAKAHRRAPHQTARSASHCQDNLEETCPQLLPQPQEGLTSHSLTHCRAPDTALYVTASWNDGGVRCIFDVRNQTESSPILVITDRFSPPRLPYFPPSSVLQGKRRTRAKRTWKSGSRQTHLICLELSSTQTAARTRAAF